MHARVRSRGARALVGVLFAMLVFGAASGDGAAQHVGQCLSWSEARNAGWIERFNLKPASSIKAAVETRYKGKVVNFLLCSVGGRVVYQLTVYQPDGNVLFVEEPAQ